MGARVADAMTLRAVTVASDQDLYHAYAVMRRGGFRHLPVVDNGELVGILSDRDVLFLAEKDAGVLTVGNRPIADAMSKDVRTCKREDRLGDVIDTMLRYHIDAMPIVDAEMRVVGIVTSTDILAALRRHEGVTDLEMKQP